MPLGQAIVEEWTASSSSLKEEIDRFLFEEETIVISEVEEEADEYLCVQTPAPIITYVGDSSNNEEKDMAPKTGPSLRELMKGRNKAPFPQEKSKSKSHVNPPPPPPQLSADLGLKPNPDLRRKRHTEALEEGEMALPKGANSQGNHRTNGVGDPALLIAERSFLWLKCTVQPVLGRLSWRWTVCPLPGMLPLSITVGGTLVM